jgi:acyl dehydratase
MTLYYEDIATGDVRDLGRASVTEADIVAFAEQFDPQPLHVDPDAARESPYGGLIASGWHTACVCMRLLAENFLNDTVSYGAFGLDELRWQNPVRPGDTIRVEHRVLSKRPSESYDDRGYVENEVVGYVDGDEVVYWRATNIVGRRGD